MAVLALLKIFKDPTWGIVGVFTALPLEPFMPQFGGITLGRLIGVLAILSWFFNYYKFEKYRLSIKNSPIVNRVAFFGIAIVVSSSFWLFELGGETAMANDITVLLLCLFAIMVQSIVTSNTQVAKIGFGLVFASSIACIPGFLFTYGYDVYSFFGAEAPKDLTEESLRATNIGGSANELGIIARNGIYGGLIFLLFNKNKKVQIVNLVLLFICLAGLFLSGSRTNFFGVGILVAVALIVMLIKLKGNLTKFILPTIIGAVLLSFVWSLAPALIKERLFLGQKNERIAERVKDRQQFVVDQRQQSLDYLFEYPFTGIGLNRTNQMTGGYGAHDSFSVIVGETGLIGIFAFLFLTVFSMFFIIKQILYQQDVSKIVPLGFLLGSFLSVIIMGVGVGLVLIYDRTFYLTIGLITPISTGLLISEHLKKTKGIN